MTLLIIPLYGQVKTGAENIPAYLPLLKGKKIGIIAHAASRINGKDTPVHLLDSLLSLGVKVTTIFAPEHGFLSNQDNGAFIEDGIETKTQLKIVSLHGKTRKPPAEEIQKIDLILFDLQDVGVRFYTYLSTLHLTMEACAENNIPMILLDRPNPNAHYVDGPVMENEFKSFLGKHNIPIVHGLTLGEFAQMINGEGWLKNKIKCDLKVIKNQHYTHQTPYKLPVPPSPNLPNAQAVNLYPSLCLFEQTPVSIGRGTEKQFQIYGHPVFKNSFSFIPKPNFGAKHPKLEGEICRGKDLRKHHRLAQIELKWLLEAYANYPDKENFFSPRFVKLAGTKKLEEQIQQGWSQIDIRASWEPALSNFKDRRKKYLLYPD